MRVPGVWAGRAPECVQALQDVQDQQGGLSSAHLTDCSPGTKCERSAWRHRQRLASNEPHTEPHTEQRPAVDQHYSRH